MSRQELAEQVGSCAVVVVQDTARAALTHLPHLIQPALPCSQAARVVLGQFKKQHKRRDPNLRPWEEGGHRMQVLSVLREVVCIWLGNAAW